MSGGSLDYSYVRVQTLAEDIQQQIDSNNVKNDLGFSNEFSEETLSKMQQTENMLITVSKLAKEVEWLLSGDTGEDTFKENFDKIMNETDNFRKK